MMMTSALALALAVQAVPASPPVAMIPVGVPSPPPPPPPRPPMPIDVPIAYHPDAAPFYPRKERRAGVEGTARVALSVRLDGSVSRCRIVRDSGSARLDAAACKLGRKLRFARAAAAATRPRAEHPCCAMVDIVWGGGTARLRPLRSPALPRIRLVELVSDADYPAAALRAGQQGTVGFRLDLDATGAVTQCTVMSSSGSAPLDETTCRILRERVRAEPARDEYGEPEPGTIISRLSWRIAS